MAQYLLEQMYGCTFYEEADKRVNLKTVEADKHTDGIDVPGIWIDNDRVRFVICEVKASQEKKIPCSEALKQIEEKKYAEGLKRQGMKKIMKYGIAFYEKECMAVMA